MQGRILIIIGIAASFCAGCVQTKLTEPPRAAVEQLLLSTAADRALQTVSLLTFTNQKVFVSSNFFDGYDAKYALGTIRDVLSRAGALLMETEKEADVVIEPRSGALSIDSAESLVGIPNTGLPIPLAGTLALPEIALFKSQRQYSTAKIALLAYSRQSRAHYFSSGPMVGKAYNKYYKFLGYVSYTSTDLPEKAKRKRAKPKQAAP